MEINMAAQVLSGSSNPSYTNNTGQNVRLVINSLRNCTAISWAGVSINPILASNLIPNNVGLTNVVDQPDRDPSLCGTGWYNISSTPTTNPYVINRELVIVYRGSIVYNAPYTNSTSNTQFATNKFISFNNVQYYPSTYIGEVGYGGLTGDNSNAFELIVVDKSPINELVLAPNETFSATSESYNILVIKEDGT